MASSAGGSRGLENLSTFSPAINPTTGNYLVVSIVAYEIATHTGTTLAKSSGSATIGTITTPGNISAVVDTTNFLDLKRFVVPIVTGGTLVLQLTNATAGSGGVTAAYQEYSGSGLTLAGTQQSATLGNSTSESIPAVTVPTGGLGVGVFTEVSGDITRSSKSHTTIYEENAGTSYLTIFLQDTLNTGSQSFSDTISSISQWDGLAVALTESAAPTKKHNMMLRGVD